MREARVRLLLPEAPKPYRATGFTPRSRQARYSIIDELGEGGACDGLAFRD